MRRRSPTRCRRSGRRWPTPSASPRSPRGSISHPERSVHGVLIVDKPAGVSSALAVDRVKHALGVRRVGHGGTLDPLATGVLAICLGGATKIAQYLLADDKAYEADGLLGVEMDTL